MFSPLEQFEIVPLFLFYYKFVFTNSTYFLFLVVFISLFFFYLTNLNNSIVPNKWQLVVELIYQFIQKMTIDSLGLQGSKYFPFLFVTFCFVFSCNILGMIPYTFTITSHIILTFSLGMMTFLGLNIIGLKNHGFHFFSLFIPPGSPIILAPLLVPIELISYVFRVFALAVRLFANMMAGHTLLKILASFAWKMLSYGGIFLFIQLIPIIIIIAIIGLEIAIAFLQAYVWTTLICLYLNDVLNLH